MEQLRCVVERITYQNPENGYTIMLVKAAGHSSLISLVGNLFDVPVGSELLCEGTWKENPRYGTQFTAVTWEEVMPTTLHGIERYIGSGLIAGVGPAYAKRIVDHFGLDTIAILDNNIERLREIPALGDQRIEQIIESWEKHKGTRNVMMFLHSNGVSRSYASKIYSQYGGRSITIMRNNPYRLADDIKGIGFKTADAIASKMGFEKNDLRRCKCGVCYVLNDLTEDGHVYAEKDQLLKASLKLLKADENVICQAIDELIEADEFKAEDDAIYLPAFYDAETETAKMLIDLAESSTDETPGSTDNSNVISGENGIQYDEVQIEAIQKAITSKVMVLTGGPGTGKTTTTQGIISAFKRMGLHILLAAPTGRAAKRMSEATSMKAKTIHRLLEFSPPYEYKRNKENPLIGDALIIDECSMIDITLMHNLIKAIPANMRVIMVGDTDQLPCIGAGNVLRDIIESERIPVIRLTRIFRQAQSSRIVMNAHAINQGKPLNTRSSQNSDFMFISEDKPEEAAAKIIELIKEELTTSRGYKCSDIQVLTPMQRGAIGGTSLNAALQKALNPSEKCLRRGEQVFKEGDRVMQLKNDYEKDIFNGDFGYITSINMDDKTLNVNIDGRVVEYEADDLDELTLAYATTVHKSQGSEYPVVIMPVMMTHYIMLQRNLIYTGLTRAKELCIMIGTKQALSCAIRNNAILKRNTKLKDRLKKIDLTRSIH